MEEIDDGTADLAGAEDQDLAFHDELSRKLCCGAR
jgi:hypothetical protein